MKKQYKQSTIDKINNLKLNQTMRLGRTKIICIDYTAFDFTCEKCYLHNNNCKSIQCLHKENANCVFYKKINTII